MRASAIRFFPLFRSAPSGGRALVAASAALLLVIAPFPAAAASSDLPWFRKTLLARINQFRAQRGRPPLEAEPRLEAASQEWAEHLALLGRLRHRSDASLAALRESGAWEEINENLYYSSSPLDPETVLADWEKSPPHRKNLLNPIIRFAGLGRAAASSGAVYVVFNGAGGEQRKRWQDLWKSLPFPGRDKSR